MVNRNLHVWQKEPLECNHELHRRGRFHILAYIMFPNIDLSEKLHLICFRFGLYLQVIKKCTPDPSKHIVCTNRTDHECERYYHGPTCSNYCIDPDPAKGRCDENGTLICNKQYYGQNCSTHCNLKPELEHAHCDENGTIVCDENFYGPKCNMYCHPEHGVCNNYGMSICHPDYYGKNCSIHCLSTVLGNCSSNGTLVCNKGSYF